MADHPPDDWTNLTPEERLALARRELAEGAAQRVEREMSREPPASNRPASELEVFAKAFSGLCIFGHRMPPGIAEAALTCLWKSRS
jgi:hypothetical protein